MTDMVATGRKPATSVEPSIKVHGELVAKKMTPAQLAEAQNLAREWQAAFDARQE